MRFRTTALLFLMTAACGPAPHTDITGPFTGVTYRFAVDAIALPQQRLDFADDLNGDGRADDQLGNVVGVLAGQMALTSGIDDMLGSGTLAPVVEITTDDPALRDDPTVGVRFLGRDGAPADELGASLQGGRLVSNRTATLRHPATAMLALPLLADADPLPLPVIGLELELQPDATGFTGALHGAFASETIAQPVAAGFQQMIAARPTRYAWLVSFLDADRDGAVSGDELLHILESVTAPDVQLRDEDGRFLPSPHNTHKDALSFGLGVHLVPCAEGSCHAPPADPCRDRVRDGDETDVDCGGTCAVHCPGGAACSNDGDCQTGRCTAGVCAAPSCADGVRDGFELAVDCGNGCPGCPTGTACANNADCASGVCSLTCAAPGTCGDGIKDGGEEGVDCGGPCPPCS